MKILTVLFLLATLTACQTSDKKTSGITEEAPDSQVALTFLNNYVQSCNALQDSDRWIAENTQLSDAFKTAYKKLVDDARKADPELGLDFDPIFDAQDYDEKGYQIASIDEKSGIVELEGVSSPDDRVNIRVKKIGDRTLVDGAGVIRMK